MTRALTIADAIDTTRAMVDRDLNAVFPSPDGRRYALMLITGDVARDGVHARLLVGRLDTFDGAVPSVAAELFTRGLGSEAPGGAGSYELTVPALNVPRWLDAQRLALLWEDAHGVRQVVAVDVNTRRVRYLTHHDRDVVYFSATPSGVVLYGAVAPCEPIRSEWVERTGFAVQSVDAWLPFESCGMLAQRNHELFVSAGQGPSRRVSLGGSAVNRFVSSGDALPVVAPDGRHAIAWMSIPDGEIQAAWRGYQHPLFASMLREAEAGAESLAARQLKRLALVDLAEASARPLTAAPSPPQRPLIAWSPDSRSVAVGRTFAPLTGAEDEAGAQGFAVMEVQVATGVMRRIPVTIENARRVVQLRWIGGDQVELVAGTGEARRFRKTGDQWRENAKPQSAKRSVQAAATPRVRVELRQGLNAAPALYAVDAHDGREQRLYDLNPQLGGFTLGQVEWLELKDERFGQWEGRLYYPVHFEQGRAYPLIVQTHTYAGKEEFSLSGKGGTQPALGPGWSAYIAQPLANRGFFVLHGGLIEAGSTGDSVELTRRRVAALEHVVARLVSRGWVARDKVGLMGFSASGWLVDYAITHSQFPYAAAVTDDNKDGGYLQASLANWPAGLGEELIGAAPFGEGFQAWLRESPAFNAERIRAPLLLSVTSPGLELGAWELFSRLRRLKRPVEFFIIPKFQRGAHNLQNPGQLRALQERTLDWWCFWLKSEEDPDPAKAQQYRQWRALRSLNSTHAPEAPAGAMTSR